MACFHSCTKITSLLAAYQAPRQTKSVWQQNLLSKTLRVPCSGNYFLNGWRSIRSDKKNIRCISPQTVDHVSAQSLQSINPAVKCAQIQPDTCTAGTGSFAGVAAQTSSSITWHSQNKAHAWVHAVDIGHCCWRHWAAAGAPDVPSIVYSLSQECTCLMSVP